jgi:glycosyltransferase involved in cell wall biosynthesis
MPCGLPSPRISVITACLNAAGTIEQTIRSVLDQNYPTLEYIIIDGGSIDGVLDVVDKYKARISTVVSEPDGGIYDAFNKGLRLATGELIGILNADDFYAPWTFEKVSEAYAARPECDVFYGRVAVIDDEEKRWKVYARGSERGLVDGMSTPHPATFLPKRTYGKWGFFDDGYRIAGDWDYFLRLYMGRASFCPVDHVLTAFRSSGMSSLLSKRQLDENKLVYLKYLDKNAASKKIAKMYLKYYGRRFMKAAGLYNLYAAYRDSRLLDLEASGVYGDPASMWESLNQRFKGAAGTACV